MMRRWRLIVTAAAALGVLALVPAANLYYRGSECANCHEIRPMYDAWRVSTHRGVACGGCHESAVLRNVRRVATHLRGDVPEQVRVHGADLEPMLRRCQACHRQEFADWRAGPHGVTYQKIFLDAQHNRKHQLRDDCLRCHGAHFDGGIRDVVTPVDLSGPWKLVRPEMADLPAIPCMACHQMHREGSPRRRAPAAAQELMRPSVALFDRRAMMHVAGTGLVLPAMREGERPVRMSPDIRQALCYQCHAPGPERQVRSGDDRTGLGVHEGISCLACHQKHGQQARASCATCHPRLSSCGLDVERMDTTFRSPQSAHNIHFVQCADCHSGGVPRRRPLPGRAGSATPPAAAP